MVSGSNLADWWPGSTEVVVLGQRSRQGNSSSRPLRYLQTRGHRFTGLQEKSKSVSEYASRHTVSGAESIALSGASAPVPESLVSHMPLG